MPSLPTGKPSLICCTHFLFLFLFASSHVRGASLRQRGSESQRGGGGDFLQSPNDDMLKALEFIESLRQRSGTRTGYEADDAEKLRAMLRLAPKEEEEEEEEEEGRENKSEELLQAVLSTLQETEKASKQTPLRPRVQQHGIKPHRKMPLMFEDEEEGEGDEEEEGEEGPAPFKRTNENVEEKYTPQNLATLQSVFDELDKMTSVKTKRQREEEEEGDEGEDVFNVRNVAYDDVGGDLADWGEGEEEEEGRGVDYDEEADDDEEEEKYPVKRSKDTDEVANLVDYYLLKVLERTEEEEHKREIEEEEKKREEEEKKKRDTMDQRTIYQLIQISQKYQIPPEDLVDMLSTGETAKPRKPSPVPPKKTHKSPEGTFFNTRVPERRKTPEERRTEEILSILGLGGVEDKTPVRKESSSSSSSSAPPSSRFHTVAEPPASQRRRLPSGTLQDDYDDTLDEDELAAYLAAQMLARYPVNKHRNNKVSPTREEQRGAGSFEQNIQAYFDQMEEETKEKRHTEDEEDEDKTKGFDNEAVMKLMSYLNPDTDERERDATTEREK
ncbi:hypothetical protein CesoFtcFv8_005847 [Champsocephalus esox]|uniref:Secretogranin II n=1 Tax=Champsocephalus esox TaxID=159716 RepID=A0AAN8H697_9TELE|nr:hypothetical protein CesoFtcFv8_005847 [Champsocephalus esox]